MSNRETSYPTWASGKQTTLPSWSGKTSTPKLSASPGLGPHHAPPKAKPTAQPKVAPYVPPPMVRVNVKPPTVTTAQKVYHATSTKPFFLGQKPDHFASLGRLGLIPIYVYGHGKPGPTGDDKTQLNSNQLAFAAHEKYISEGGLPGALLRDTATSLVPKTFVDLAQGNHVTGSHVVSDIANAALNFAPAGKAAGILGGLKGLKALKDTVDVARLAPDEVKALQIVKEGVPLEKRLAEAKGKELKDLKAAAKHVHDVNGVPRIVPSNHKLIEAYQRQAASEVLKAPIKAAHTTKEAAQVREALKGAAAVRGNQAAGFSVQRGSRFKKAEEIYNDVSLTPEERQIRADAALKGQLDRPTFMGFKKLTPENVTNLKSQIMTHPSLRTGQKTTLLHSLDAAVGGKVPTTGEHKLFEQTFGKDTAAGIRKAATTGLWKNIATNVINAPRTLQSTLDMSAFLRQGAVALGRHPIITGKNFVPLVKAFGSENYALGIEKSIAEHPDFPLAQTGGVAFTGSGALQKHEEQFASNLLENLGGSKNPIHWSSRSYSAFLNKTRMDIFSHLLGVAKAQGRNVHDEQFLKELGDLVNDYTGRGNLGRAERAANVFNGLFFSPRLAKSRIDILTKPFNLALARRNPFVYRQYVRAAAQTFGAMVTILTLAKLNGADVGLNPESADFGKIKFGNTRVDLGAGFLQFFHLGGQLVTGKSVSTTSGKVSHIYSGKPFQTSGWDILTNFGVGKLSPPFAIAHDVLAQQTNHGKFNVWQELYQHLLPLSGQDIQGVATDHSKGHLPLAAVPAAGLFSVLGGGLQTYGPKKSVSGNAKDILNMPGVSDQARKQISQFFSTP